VGVFFYLGTSGSTRRDLASCGREAEQYHLVDIGGSDIEIDAPRLRSFVYKGFFRRLLLRSPAPDLALVDLHFFDISHGYREDDNDKERTRTLFWQFLHNFTNARVLKLKVNCGDLKDIAAIGRARRAELLTRSASSWTWCIVRGAR
jgi:hypothetical protein